MRPGCMLYSLGRALREGTLTVPGALKLMKESGAEAVDLDAGNIGSHPIAEVRTMVADAGLIVSTYIGGASLAEPVGPDRRAAIDKVRGVLDAAAELGAPIAMLTTGRCADGQPPAEGRANVVSGLSELLAHAADVGVIPAIEDFGAGGAPYQTGAECLEVCDLTGPALKFTYDSGNMIMGDDDPVSFLELIKARVVHVHAKDWKEIEASEPRGLAARSGRRYVGELVGRGVLDYPAIFQTLRAMQYDGYVSFEYEGDGDPVQAARDGIAFLRAAIG